MSKPSFKRTRKLTKPLLKLTLDQEYFIKIVSPIVIEDARGKQELDSEGKPKAKKVFTLMDVINLETGEDNKILVNKVLEDILNEHYPDKSYVGKGFALIKFPKQSGREYHTYNVEEIEIPEDKAAAKESEPTKAEVAKSVKEAAKTTGKAA